MPEEILQNTPATTDLTVYGLTTGWSFSGNVATHEDGNDGSIFLDAFDLVAGRTYEISFNIVSISGGYLRAYAGDTASPTQHTTAGFKTETLLASGTSPEFRFFSNANVVVEVFNIRDTAQSSALKQTNSIAFSEKSNKWTDYRTFNPDIAFSMFTKLFSFKQGVQYVHDPQSGNRNSFYGNQYKTIVKIPFNGQPTQTQTFQSVALQNNQLMITTTDGITTSLGQVSELYEWNFEKARLIQGATEVVIYEHEGVYSASFLRNKTEDIVNGSVLKGNYLVVEMQTVNTGILKLFTASVHSSPSRIGSR